MGTTPSETTAGGAAIRGKIVEAEIKVSVDPGHPLPLASALYAIQTDAGVWLCAFYGTNRSVFDFLPQKDTEVDESKLGISFQEKKFVPGGEYQPAVWEEFKKSRLMTYNEPQAK